LFLIFFPGTRRTDALDQKTDSLTDIAFREFHPWHMKFMQAVGLMTLFTKEVNMLIIVLLRVMAVAPLILSSSINALYGMNQMILPEKHERTENIRLIDRQNPILQFRHGKGALPFRKSLHDKDTIGSRTNAMGFQQFNTIANFHTKQLLSAANLGFLFVLTKKEPLIRTMLDRLDKNTFF
jgi:hypothetical protein